MGMGIGVYYFQRLENNELFVWVRVRVGVYWGEGWGVGVNGFFQS